VQGSLSSGTIEPLRLEFATTELVYPLRISSLNSGDTKIRLHLLSDHRMGCARREGSFSGQFKTAFAGRVDAPNGRMDVARLAEFARLVRPERRFLTQLWANVSANDMDGDVWFQRARSDRPFRELVDRNGYGRPLGWLDRLLLPFDPVSVGWVVVCLLLGWLIGINMRRFRRRRYARVRE
jgi:hypothetical protein